MKLCDVATDEVISFCHNLGPGADSRRLDSSALTGAAERLRAVAGRPSDILVLSKFGKQPAAACGRSSPSASPRAARC